MIDLLSTRGVHPRDQIERLRNIINQGFCHCDVESETVNGGYDAELETINLGNINVLKYHGCGVQRARRRIDHVRADQTDNLLLYLPLTAVVDMEHAGSSSRFLPGHFAFVNTAYPFSGAIYAGNGENYSAIFVKTPTPRVRECIPAIDRYRNRPFPVRGGSSRLMVAFLDTLVAEGHSLAPSEAHFLGNSLLNIIVSAAHESICGQEQAAACESPSTKGQTFKRIICFIEENLSNPNLNTCNIARSCGISVRYLHAVFEDTPYTVSSWIREQRLRKCREAFRNPEAAGLSIIAVAMAWGFNDPSHFTRIYKARFGLSPSAERALECHADSGRSRSSCR